MKKTVEQEIKKIIEELNPNITIDEFRDNADWSSISEYQQLSEDFIREFQDAVDWEIISYYQRLSENFMREFQDKLDWSRIAHYQRLSEDFIREFRDRLDMMDVSIHQELSEDFIKEFHKDDVWDWEYLVRHQKLSEEFFREFKGEPDLNWDYNISVFHKLCPEFIEEFKDRLNVKAQLQTHWDTRTISEKRAEMRAYADKWYLKFEDDILYAYRRLGGHNGDFYSHIQEYKKGIYYRNWRCDLRPDERFSFGYTIYPADRGENYVPVKVRLEDWGIAVTDDNGEGMARVWGFEII
jgi:hypothetical protein